MPARKEEVAHAKEEGFEFNYLTNAKRILGNDKGKVNAIEFLKYKLGEPDDSGRRRPVVIESGEFIINVDTVIVAIGNGSNPLIKQTTLNPETNRWSIIIVDENQKSSMDRVFAGEMLYLMQQLLF